MSLTCLATCPPLPLESHLARLWSSLLAPYSTCTRWERVCGTRTHWELVFTQLIFVTAAQKTCAAKLVSLRTYSLDTNTNFGHNAWEQTHPLAIRLYQRNWVMTIANNSLRFQVGFPIYCLVPEYPRKNFIGAGNSKWYRTRLIQYETCLSWLAVSVTTRDSTACTSTGSRVRSPSMRTAIPCFFSRSLRSDRNII